MGYEDRNLSPDERARDLLNRMTLREKVGQLNQHLYGFSIYKRKGSDIELTKEFCDEVSKWGGLGVLYGLYRADPWSDKDEGNGITPNISKTAYNKVQRYVIEHSRFGIPMLLSTECPHGHQALGGGILPVNTALGATFDDELVEEAYRLCGRQLKEGHVDFALMSVLDVLRDPRWGRSEECYSEDPYLSSRLAASAVRGMQSSKVYSVAKHLCAQGEGTGGVNASAALIGERELRDIHLASAKAVCGEKVKGVMAAYNEIDGMYCHANKHLLEDILRDEYGFDGVVMADGFALDALDKITGDNCKSGALAISSGVDISLWDNAFTKLEEAVEKGYVDAETIDSSVLRVLTMKFERGLFEHPYMDDNMHDSYFYGIDKISEKLAKESIVLLKNERLLPLNKNKYSNVAIIGPNADSLYALLGDYTPPIDDDNCKSLLGELRARFDNNCNVDYLDHVWDERDADRQDADKYDLVIAVCGGSSSRYEGTVFDSNGAALKGEVLMDCGEGVDLSGLNMQGNIEEKLKAFRKADKLSICVAGRPYVIGNVEDLSDALVYAFYPGPYGAKAIADVIFGDSEPMGRLPVSIPRSATQLPVYYNYKDSYAAMKYADNMDGPLHVFGEGLSYTDVNFKNVTFEFRKGITNNIKPKEVVLKAFFEVENVGIRDYNTVMQLYIHRIGGGVTSRIRELKGYKRISIGAMDSYKGVIELAADKLYFYKADISFGLENCDYEIFLVDNKKVLGQTVLHVNI